MRPVTIYALCSSRDCEIRYIGQTTQTVKHRLAQHKSYARKLKSTAVHKWLVREMDQGFDVQIMVICHDAIWNTTEIELIAKYKEMGCRLLNLTEGGEGTVGYSPEYRARPDVAERNRNTKPWLGRKHTEESKQKVREAKLGKPAPWNIEKNKARIGLPGHKHTEEFKRKLSERNRTTIVSAETCAKISSSKKAKGVKLTAEQIATLRAGHKRYFDNRRNNGA